MEPCPRTDADLLLNVRADEQNPREFSIWQSSCFVDSWHVVVEKVGNGLVLALREGSSARIGTRITQIRFGGDEKRFCGRANICSRKAGVSMDWTADGRLCTVRRSGFLKLKNLRHVVASGRVVTRVSVTVSCEVTNLIIWDHVWNMCTFHRPMFLHPPLSRLVNLELRLKV